MAARIDLTDVLRAAIEWPDARCGPPVLALTRWAPEWLELQPSDVQKQPEREYVPPTTVPVYLGTGGRADQPLGGAQRFETYQKRSPKDLAKVSDLPVDGAAGVA